MSDRIWERASAIAEDARRDTSVRERIRLRLPGAQREQFDEVMAWEDDMLAWCNEMAERLDRYHETFIDIAIACGEEVDDRRAPDFPDVNVWALVAVMALRRDYDEALDE